MRARGLAGGGECGQEQVVMCGVDTGKRRE